MTISFATLWETIDRQNSSPLPSSGEEGRAAAVVRAGEALHGEGETSFWDEFVSLCRNSEGMASLLGVSGEQVRRWPAKIREISDRLSYSRTEKEKKDEMLPTGSNGAVVFGEE